MDKCFIAIEPQMQIEIPFRKVYGKRYANIFRRFKYKKLSIILLESIPKKNEKSFV